MTRLYWSACSIRAVISVTPALTVWCDGHHLTWRYDGVPVTWPAHDTAGAAARLAELAHPHDQS
jgi:hypothetical protein